jgi:hypothetical protein
MTVTISRERQAGQLYSAGLNAVRAGGLELHSLAMHLIMMISGTSDFAGPLWPVRELNDGSVRQLDRFIDYLLQPARDGIGLPSLYFLKRTLEATVPAKDGDRALALVRAELIKEHVDFDAVAKRDEMRLHGEREPAAQHGGDHSTEQGDNVPLKSHRGNSAVHLAARIKRERPDISERLANGEFRSVRAAAIEAGIITPPTALERIFKLLPKLSADERAELRRRLD